MYLLGFCALLFLAASCGHDTRVAVCITGQRGRLQLEHLMDSVLKVNADGENHLQLDLFIRLQTVGPGPRGDPLI